MAFNTESSFNYPRDLILIDLTQSPINRSPIPISSMDIPQLCSPPFLSSMSFIDHRERSNENNSTEPPRSFQLPPPTSMFQEFNKKQSQ